MELFGSKRGIEKSLGRNSRFLRELFLILPEERENSSEVSFHSSEVSFDSSEEIEIFFRRVLEFLPKNWDLDARR